MHAFFQGGILNIAHRGAHEHVPENTLPAFARAAALGADGIELDVMLCADGVPVVIHDEDVSRTTDGSGSVAHLTLNDIKALDAGGGVQIPTLAEVFTVYDGLVNVELKCRTLGNVLPRAVAEVIRSEAERVLVSSFNPVMLRHMHGLLPSVPLGLLIAPAARPLRSLAGHIDALHPHFSTVDDHLHDLPLNVWTVNEADDIRHMREQGVNAIISDHPDRVKDILSE